MYCDVCKKNPANIHYTKIVNGHKEERHLCDACANQLQETNTPFPALGLMPEFSMADFIGGFFNQGNQAQAYVQKNIQASDACPFCKMTAGEFRQLGQLGCSHCYGYFADYIPNLMQRIHGSTVHVGKVPHRGHKELRHLQQIDDLKQQLNAAIGREDFEKAAHLRDEIKKLEIEQAEGGEENA